MASPLGMAILTLLAREPLTGYELSRSMKGPIRFFWQVGHSQVYPELARLEREGLVGHTRIPQAGRPDQKRYGLSPAGREALRAWLVSPLEPAQVRSELSLRAYGLAEADPEGARALFQGQARFHQARLAAFTADLAQLEAQPGGVPDDPREPGFGDHAVLMRGITLERAQAEWCEWMAQRLSRPKGSRRN